MVLERGLSSVQYNSAWGCNGWYAISMLSAQSASVETVESTKLKEEILNLNTEANRKKFEICEQIELIQLA
jgi:hypothetical protein